MTNRRGLFVNNFFCVIYRLNYFCQKQNDMNSDIKAVLFDFDGVVVDTEGQYTHFWESISEQYFPHVDDIVAKVKGQTLRDVFDKYLYGDEEKQRAVKKALEDYERCMHYENVAGVAEFVATLRRNDIKTAVVTSSDNIKMKYVYVSRPDILSMFDKIFTAEDYNASKPSPECYVKAARHFGFLPSQSVVAEDSLNGLKAAKASGSFVLGLTTTNPKKLVEHYADMVIPDFNGFMFEDLNKAFRLRLGKTE